MKPSNHSSRRPHRASRGSAVATGALLSVLALTLAVPAVRAAPPDGPEVSTLAAPRAPILTVENIERGQTGYGLTVFSGTAPERFEVEVIGVLRNTDPSGTYILAKLSGHGLEVSGVAAGMSGSPVFIDDRLVGAVAFAWPFAKEAIAGITPIESMRAIAELPSGLLQPPDPLPMAAGAASRVDLASLLSGELPADLLETGLALLAPADGRAPGSRTSIQWLTGGFGEASQAILARSLGAVSASGTGAATSADDLVAGAPVAAVLVDGDLQLAATGTVTERNGDEVLAFGHAFLGLGPLSVPMAGAEILTVLPSSYSSFKISNMGPVVGAFEQDSQSGIRGHLGAEARMIPLHLAIRGVRDRDFEMRLADIPQLVAPLLAASTLGGLDAASFANGAQGIDLEASFQLAGWGDLTVRQSFDGPQAATDTAIYLLSLTSYLTGNPLERVEIEEIAATLVQHRRPRTATLVAAHAERTVVRPGETVRLDLELKSFQGERFRHAVEVAIPDDLPAGKLSLLVGDGESADAARIALEQTQPVSFADALELLRSFHSQRELVILQVFRGDGLSVPGSTLARLPGSVRSIWGAAASESAKPLRLAVSQVEAGELELPVSGLVRIDLDVRRRQPLAADDSGEDAPGEPAGDEGGPDGGPPDGDGAGASPRAPAAGSTAAEGGR